LVHRNEDKQEAKGGRENRVTKKRNLPRPGVLGQKKQKCSIKKVREYQGVELQNTQGTRSELIRFSKMTRCKREQRGPKTGGQGGEKEPKRK